MTVANVNQGLIPPPMGLQGQIFLASVIDNNDQKNHPDTQPRGRIRVRIKFLHRGIPDEHLPWAISLGATNGTGPNISLNIPEIGSLVFVLFQQSNPYDMIYIGAPTHITNAIAPEFLGNYPFMWGWVDPSNSLFIVDSQKLTTHYIHVSGSYFILDKTGSLELGIAKADLADREIKESSKYVEIDGIEAKDPPEPKALPVFSKLDYNEQDTSAEETDDAPVDNGPDIDQGLIIKIVNGGHVRSVNLKLEATETVYISSIGKLVLQSAEEIVLKAPKITQNEEGVKLDFSVAPIEARALPKPKDVSNKKTKEDEGAL